MKNNKYILLIVLFLGLYSCEKEDLNQVFSRGSNKMEFGELGGKEHCDFEVVFNEIADFYAVYNLKAIGEGKGYRPEDKTGDFVKFDLEKGQITESETEWDIAFRYATIIVNGGEKIGYKDEPNRTAKVSAYIEEKPFEKIEDVLESKFKEDRKSKLAIPDDVQNGKGLWSYSMTYHYVLPIPARVAVFKTRNGKYVKMQIGSFYKCMKRPKPADESYGYYSFRYAEIK